MNILVTGSAGLIGSNFCYWLINNTDHEVIGIDNLSGGYYENMPTEHERFSFYNIDLLDKLDVIFKIQDIDYVYHYSSYAAEGLSPFIRTFNYKNNLVCTANIINMCIKYNIKRLVFTSSMAVYGRNKPPFDESYTPNPIDPYGIAKYACEMDIKVAAEQHALDYCIIRPHNIFGQKQNIWDKYRNVLGIWMYEHMHNKPIVVFGSGEQVRAFSYIEDILEPLYKAGISDAASERTINLGGITPVSIKEAAEILSKVVGGADIIHKETRHEVHQAYSTWENSVRYLGYTDNHNLEDGLSKMWKWAKVQPERPQFIWPEYEINKGIYSYWKNK